MTICYWRVLVDLNDREVHNKCEGVFGIFLPTYSIQRVANQPQLNLNVSTSVYHTWHSVPFRLHKNLWIFLRNHLSEVQYNDRANARRWELYNSIHSADLAKGNLLLNGTKYYEFHLSQWKFTEIKSRGIIASAK